jgi:dolichyl-phosphate-mannose-protein mannosyltransferase
MEKKLAYKQNEIQNPNRFWTALFIVAALVTAALCVAPFTGNSNWVILATGIIFLAGAFCAYAYMEKKNYTVSSPANVITILLLIGIVLRLFLACAIYGYKSDISCWMGWSNSAFSNGLDRFYTSGQFADYPPLYIYVLYFLGAAANVFHISVNTLMVKLPAIICDCITAYLVYKLASTKTAPKAGSLPKPGENSVLPVIMFACIMLNPAIFMNSAVWGQIDIIYTLLAVLCVYLLIQKKTAFAIVLFMLALLLKVQSFLIAPVILFVVIEGLSHKETRKAMLVQLFAGAAVAIGLAFLLIMPFGGGRPITWIVRQYGVSLGVYQYATVNGFNLYGLFNLNWVPLKETFLGLPYLVWGITGEVAVFAYSAWLFVKNHSSKNLFNILAFIVLGVYMFAQGMHERYSFAAPVLLLFSWCMNRDKRIFYAALFASATVLANQCVALQYDGGHWIPYGIMAPVSLANLLAFAYTAVVITKIAIENKKTNKGKVGYEHE